MSIPLKLFLAISLEWKSAFRDVRIKANLDLRLRLSERNKMADRVEIRFFDENDFAKEGNWYLLSENLQWETSPTLCGRLGKQTYNILSGIDISQPTP